MKSIFFYIFFLLLLLILYHYFCIPDCIIDNIQNNNTISNDNNSLCNIEKDILFISAFVDIGREKWKHLKRTNEEYFQWFYNLASNIEYKLLVYIDDDIREQLFSKYKFKDNIEFYKRKDVNTFMKRYLEKEQNILDSDEFKKKIPKYRLGKNPETWCAKYNLSNHSKVNYVLDAKRKYPNYKFYSWIDFGYVRDNIENVPRNLQIEKIPEKIIYEAFYLPSKIDEIEVLQINDTIMKGSGFIVPNNVVESFHNKYEKKIIHWYNHNISDDDESLILQLYYDEPYSFHIIIDKSWFSIYKHFM
jgi:hypothetical protein